MYETGGSNLSPPLFSGGHKCASSRFTEIKGKKRKDEDRTAMPPKCVGVCRKCCVGSVSEFLGGLVEVSGLSMTKYRKLLEIINK